MIIRNSFLSLGDFFVFARQSRSGSVYLYAFVAFGEFVALLIGLPLGQNGESAKGQGSLVVYLLFFEMETGLNGIVLRCFN